MASFRDRSSSHTSRTNERQRNADELAEKTTPTSPSKVKKLTKADISKLIYETKKKSFFREVIKNLRDALILEADKVRIFLTCFFAHRIVYGCLKY